MPGVVDFIFDFGSPNAYLCWKVLPSIAARTGASINLIPCLLGGVFKATNNLSPATAFAEVKGKLAYEALETQRFVSAHGLSAFRRNPHFPVNTLLVMRGLIAARRLNIEAPYLEVVSAAMWEQGLKMDDPAVVSTTLADQGLPAAAILELAADAQVKAELISNTEAAVVRGVFGIPTFFVGNEMFFGKERLPAVEAELSHRSIDPPPPSMQ